MLLTSSTLLTFYGAQHGEWQVCEVTKLRLVVTEGKFVT